MAQLPLDRLPARALARLNLETAFMASRCVVGAERLQVFRRLHGRELSAATISRRTGIHRKYCEPFLDFLVFLGLLRKRGNRYCNSALVEKYFIRDRSISWTRLWPQECAQDYEAFSVLEEALTSGTDYRQILGMERKSDYELLREDPRWANDFTRMLYKYHEPDAAALARSLDLSDYHSLLDVGGGSGVMSVALVRANSHLRACVLDFEPVCRTARKIIREERLTRRIRTRVGDMDEGIPSGHDVIMFWDIGRLEARVFQMASDRLPEKGMLVVGGVFSPKATAASPGRFVREFLSVRPKAQTRQEVAELLRSVGLTAVKSCQISRDLWLISGRKKVR